MLFACSFVSCQLWVPEKNWFWDCEEKVYNVFWVIAFPLGVYGSYRTWSLTWDIGNVYKKLNPIKY